MGRLAYEELVDLLATSPGLANFRLSEQARARAWELAARERDGALTSEEHEELELFTQLERLVRLARIRALPPASATAA